MRTTAKSRALCACGLLAVCFTAFSFRIVQVQVTQHQQYAAEATKKQTGTQTIYARRGSIFDAHGEPLAQNEPIRTVVADGSLITDRDALATLLAGPLQLPEGVLREKLSRTVFSEAQGKRVPAQYIVLKKRVPEAVATEISAAMAEQKMRGLLFEPDSTARMDTRTLQVLCDIIEGSAEVFSGQRVTAGCLSLNARNAPAYAAVSVGGACP